MGDKTGIMVSCGTPISSYMLDRFSCAQWYVHVSYLYKPLHKWVTQSHLAKLMNQHAVQTVSLDAIGLSADAEHCNSYYKMTLSENQQFTHRESSSGTFKPCHEQQCTSGCTSMSEDQHSMTKLMHALASFVSLCMCLHHKFPKNSPPFPIIFHKYELFPTLPHYFPLIPPLFPIIPPLSPPPFPPLFSILASDVPFGFGKRQGLHR